jgi:hypothetical protein
MGVMGVIGFIGVTLQALGAVRSPILRYTVVTNTTVLLRYDYGMTTVLLRYDDGMTTV